jgi:hypothetical protein
LLFQFQELPLDPGTCLWSPQMRQAGPIGGVAAAGGQVVWSGAEGLYQTTSDWFTHTPGDPDAPHVRQDPNFGLTPTDLALMPPSGTAVPEPGSAVLAFTALAALGLLRRGRVGAGGDRPGRWEPAFRGECGPP